MTPESGGVLVSCRSRNAEAQSSGISFCSGGWILTSGTVLGPILQAQSNYKKTLNVLNDSLASNKLTGLNSSSVVDGGVKFSVLVQENANSGTNTSFSSRNPSRKLIDTSRSQLPQPLEDGVQVTDQLARSLPRGRYLPLKRFTSTASAESERMYEATSVWLWRCPLITKAVDSLLDGWTLGTTSSERDDEDSEIVRSLMPVFLVFRVKESSNQDPKQALKNLLGNLIMPARGQRLLVEGTPFNNRLFYNSVSQGIVSNICGPEDCLLLTDVRTTYGCEGAPIFCLQNGKKKFLAGMVACSLTWWRGEWVGFTLGMLLQPILRRLLEISMQRYIPASARDIPGLDDAVVLVRCGNDWGSGVVIDSPNGLLLTCSHVVAKAGSHEIKIYWKNRSIPAALLYRTRDGTAFDIAVLEITRNSGLKHISFAKERPLKGEAIIAVGFPIFSERNIPSLYPTLTEGIISHVAGADSLIQTTCCVQSGMSGGAVLRLNGELLAIVACNTQDVNSGALYPHVNMAIPAQYLAGPLNEYIRTKDVHALNSLESKDKYVQQVWKLESGKSKL